MVLENDSQTLFTVYTGDEIASILDTAMFELQQCFDRQPLCVCLDSSIFCTTGKDHPSLAECPVFIIIAPFTTEQEPGHYTYYFHCMWKVTK